MITPKTSDKVKYIRKNAGFTLVEVLVAAVILFSAIAMVSMVYRGAFISSEKADGHINITGVLPAVLATIRQDIRAQSNSARSQLSNQSNMWDVNYQWNANLLLHKSAPKRLDPDSGTIITPPAKYKLWQVELTLERNGVTKDYSFKELGWTND